MKINENEARPRPETWATENGKRRLSSPKQARSRLQRMSSTKQAGGRLQRMNLTKQAHGRVQRLNDSKTKIHGTMQPKQPRTSTSHPSWHKQFTTWKYIMISASAFARRASRGSLGRKPLSLSQSTQPNTAPRAIESKNQKIIIIQNHNGQKS